MPAEKEDENQSIQASEPTMQEAAESYLQPFIDEYNFQNNFPDPLRRMDAIYEHVKQEKPLPADLRDWFLKCLDEHKEHRGTKTFNEIFGYSQGKRGWNAYTADEVECATLSNILIQLRTYVGITSTGAARLVVWREDSDIDIDSVTRAGRDLRKLIKEDNYQFSLADYLTDNDDETVLEWQEDGLRLLQSFTDKAKVKLTGDVLKDLPKIKTAIEEIKLLPPVKFVERLAHLEKTNKD